MTDRVRAVEASIVVGGTSYRVLHYALREALCEVGGATCSIVKDDDVTPDPAALIGQDATLTLELNDGSAKRTFAGQVGFAERAHTNDGVPHLELRIVPALGRLRQRADCRIFRKKTPVEILKQVLSGGGVADQDWKTNQVYATRDHCAQYRESDLDFVQRLCAEEGIYFWVHGADGADTVHFADDPQGVAPIDGATSLAFHEVFGEHESGDYVMRVQQLERVVSDKVTLRDFDPDKPKVKLESVAESKDPGGHALEVYAYPGRFTEPSRGDQLAKTLLASVQATRNVVEGDVANLALEPGKRFQIQEHPYEPLNQEYLVISVDITGRERRAFEIEGGGAEEATTFSYRCRFTAVPTATTDYRPPRRAPTATIPGLQTAFTTGAAGEEIHTDAGGHVTVQFHWDRLGKHDAESSRWLRTSQPALGGGMLIPRVKWEVAVRFDEGDADNPYVMARLYNTSTPPPYALPQHKARGALQTATTPGGGSVNEFHMSDEKGSESFFMNASKDMTVEVNHNATESVGNNSQRTIIGNRTFSVTNSASASVGANQTLAVDGSQTVHVETFQVDQVTGDHTLRIAGDRTMMIGGDHKRDVAGDSKLTIGGMMLDAVIGNVTDATLADMHQTVGAALVELTASGRSYTVGGTRSETTAAAKIIASKGGRSVDITGTYNQMVGGAVIHSVTNDRAETAGQTYMEVAAGAHIVKADSVSFEAETMLSLVMGASTLTMMPAMVTLAGVSIKCDGDASDTASLILDN